MTSRARKGRRVRPAAAARRHADDAPNRRGIGGDLEVRLQLAIDSTRAGTHSRNLLTDEATWSPRLREIYDIPADEPARSTTWLARIHPDDRNRALRAMHAALDPGGDGLYRATFRVVRRDGSVRWVEGHGKVAFGKVAGRRRPVRLAGLTFDVTERMTMLGALRDGEERLQLALSSAGLGVFEWDIEADLLQASAQTRTMLGLSPDEAPTVGAMTRHVHPLDRAAVGTALARALDATGDGRFGSRHRVVLADGGVRWVEASGRVRFDGVVPRPLRLCGVVSDVSGSEAMLQSLREADRRKDEFLAMLAHELRNPLAPLVTAQHVIARGGALGAAEQAALAIAQRQTRQLARLVDDLLEVSRISRGKIALRLERIRLTDALSGAVESVAVAIRARRQVLVMRVPPDAPSIVADASRIDQVLGNLLGNASKYTPDGGEIRLEAEVHGDDVVLRIGDDGEGIAPEQLEAIFELFAQGETTLDRARGGLGIGLALVRRLVALHGGTVKAASAGRGHGSTFTVRLPREGPQDRRAPDGPQDRRSPDGPLQGGQDGQGARQTLDGEDDRPYRRREAGAPAEGAPPLSRRP